MTGHTKKEHLSCFEFLICSLPTVVVTVCNLFPYYGACISAIGDSSASLRAGKKAKNSALSGLKHELTWLATCNKQIHYLSYAPLLVARLQTSAPGSNRIKRISSPTGETKKTCLFNMFLYIFTMTRHLQKIFEAKCWQIIAMFFLCSNNLRGQTYKG